MRRVCALALCLATLGAPAFAADPVKVGMITTLSGPGGYLGEDMRDGFSLGAAGGTVPLQLLVEDDALKPGTAKQIAERMLKTDKARIFTGTIFTNVFLAIAPDLLEAGATVLANVPAPNNYAGKDCEPGYFASGWDETLHASAGELANRLGYKKIFLMAPNYQAGKEVIAAVKRMYKGEVAGELYTRLDQTDFAAEIAQIRAAKPDALYQFQPGGLGITFIKQYAQAGLNRDIPMVVASPSADARILAAVGDAALGMQVTVNWATGFENPASRQFVSAFREKYGREPTVYAAHGYDTARLIASALAASGNNPDAPAFRTALAKADFPTVRGHFRFASNHGPVQDWYHVSVEPGADGRPALTVKEKFMADAGGYLAEQCKMK